MFSFIAKLLNGEGEDCIEPIPAPKKKRRTATIKEQLKDYELLGEAGRPAITTITETGDGYLISESNLIQTESKEVIKGASGTLTDFDIEELENHEKNLNLKYAITLKRYWYLGKKPRWVCKQLDSPYSNYRMIYHYNRCFKNALARQQGSGT